VSKHALRRECSTCEELEAELYVLDGSDSKLHAPAALLSTKESPVQITSESVPENRSGCKNEEKNV
jgi:hypothetical protein